MYKAIKGYEVSEFGQIRSLDRIVECKDGSTRKRKGKELKLKMDPCGYAAFLEDEHGAKIKNV